MTNFKNIEEAVDSFITALQLLTTEDYCLVKHVKKHAITQNIYIESSGMKFIDISESILFLNGRFVTLHLDIFLDNNIAISKFRDKIDKYTGKLSKVSKSNRKCSFRFSTVEECIKFILEDLLEVFSDD